MIKPEIPEDELLRLETLRNLKILDTDPEERFDRVTRLAKRVFGAKMALVSLVDSRRQWFKSRQGIDVQETERAVSFCGHAILDNDPLVVNDTHIDERFSDNPLVVGDPSIRFYAGYPLSAPNGTKLGTLCIIDSKPRDMTADDLRLLNELGEMVEEEFAVASVVNSDPITGLSNLVGFTQLASHLIAFCERTELPATMMHVTLDNLELIRGAVGDEGADRAATELAQLMLANLRESDIVGRVADNEFVVLLTATDRIAYGAAESRLRQRIEERNESASMYELEVSSRAAQYDSLRHGDVDSLIADANAGIDSPETAAAAGSAETDQQ